MEFDDSYYNYFKDFIYCFQNISPQHWNNTISKFLPESELKIFKKYYTPQTRGQLNEKLLPGYTGDTKDPKEIIKYKIRSEINEALQKKKLTEEIKIILRIIRKCFHRVSGPFLSLAFSTMYKEKINFLQLGGIRFYNLTSQGRKSSETTRMKNKLPSCTVLHPTTVGPDETKYLKIPKPLSTVFNIKKGDKYLLGIREGIYSDTLYFFPFRAKTRTNFQITNFNSSFIEDTASAEDAHIFEISLFNLYIWREPITVTGRADTMYFNNIPSFFYSLLEADTILFDKSQQEPLPMEPAFVIAHDMAGNLFYHRILFTDTENHDSYPVPVILMSELPSILNVDKSVNINDLHSMKNLIEVSKDDEY